LSLEYHARMSPFFFRLLTLLLLAASAGAAEPRNFLFMGVGDIEANPGLIARPDIEGVQVVYAWKSLEPEESRYDFSQIEADLARLEPLRKQLFLQIQDRFFEREHRYVPRYLLDEPKYGGGLAPQRDNPGENQPEGSGWVAMQWNPAVRDRFQKLLDALAKQFDGRVYGINLPESAADIDQDKDTTGFTCDKYFAAEVENIRHARKAFRKSHVVQYANFWPCGWNDEHGYFSRFFEIAERERIGVGGPDIVPDRPTHMKNSYRFLNLHKGKLSLVAMAVQEPTLTYTNPKTQKKFTREEFVDFAQNHLGVDIIFWSASSPWLRENSGPAKP
jgi:hypothetical protein